MTQASESEQANKKEVTRYEKAGHIIFHGDASQVLLEQIPAGSIDLVFVDPPYNIGKKFGDFHDKWASDENYLKWAYNWLNECIRVLKPSGS
jgi:adenine-specific DNA-methyltransferase